MQKWVALYKTISAPVKASLWFTICSIIQKAISLITVPIFTRILSTEEYGIYTLYLSWHDLIIIFTALGLYNAVFNKSMLKYEKDRDGLISSFLGLTSVLTLAVFFMVAVVKNFFINLTGLNFIILCFMFLDLFFSPALSFWMARERFEYQYKKLVFVTLMIAVLNPIIGVIAVYVSQYKAEARIFSIILINVGISAVLYFYFLVKGKKFYHKEYWRYALSFNLPLVPHYLSGTILNQADRVMIHTFCGASKAAIYGVAYTAAMTVMIFTNSINASLTPWVYQSIDEGNTKSIKKINNQLLILVAGVVILLMLFGPEVMLILGGKRYMESIWVFPFVAASVFFIFLYCRFADIEFYFEKNRCVLAVSVLCAALNIGLNYIFIPIYGFAAAGVTTLICYMVDSLCHFIFVNRILKYKIDIFDYKFIFAVSIIVVAVCIFVNIIYKFIFIRYTLIVLFTLTATLKRKYIIILIKNIKK